MCRRAWFAPLAWLGPGRGLARDVRIEVAEERIAAVDAAASPAGAERLDGLVLPALANAHSHAFHRALRGQAERGGGDFWSWRELMYRVAGALDPEACFELARAAYAEMALAGVAAVGEFHYLHHDPAGKRYADSNEMGKALLAAAREAGLRVTLLDTCYLRAGFRDAPLSGAQVRFGDGSAAAWAARAELLQDGPRVRIGAAIHSVRAVPEPDLRLVADWARHRRAPLHFHLSEQRAENRACLEATGLTPTQLLGQSGVLDARSCAVHATHVTAEDIRLLSSSGTRACLCPTTERDLADGVGPSHLLAAAGVPLCLGSDSHAVIDLWEEARAVELDQRLVTERRGHHQPEDLLTAATATGMAALGWEGGRLEPGRPADLMAIRLDSPRLADAREGDLLAEVVFAATAADVTDLVVGGEPVVRGGRHLAVSDVGAALRTGVARARALGGLPADFKA